MSVWLSKDENEPEFDKSEYRVGSALMEDTPVGSSVIMVKVSDNDVSTIYQTY